MIITYFEPIPKYLNNIPYWFYALVDETNNYTISLWAGKKDLMWQLKDIDE